MSEKRVKLQETIDYLNNKTSLSPKIAIVLGSGLGGLTKEMEIIDEIPYAEIPNFPVSTVKGHKGTLIFGKLNHVEIVVMNGRFHYYEGYPMDVLTYPQLVFYGLGIKHIILSNAAGGINPTFHMGDIMVIRDHINFFGTNPLIGPNDDTLGPRFPNMSEVYSHRLIQLAEEKAFENNIHLQGGVYLGSSGPCYETQSEYRAYHILGADAVGMSTVPEAIMAHYLGIEIFAVSVITNLGGLGIVMKDTHDDVLKVTARTEPKMLKLISEMLPLI